VAFQALAPHHRRRPTDRLHIDTFGEYDRVTVTDGARALLDIQAYLGADQS
jgi:hypothetical protein